MNKIRKAIQSLQSMLAMVALVCVSSVSFTACSENDEPVDGVTYSWEFEEVLASTPDFMDDKNKIESAFKTALGASGSATSVTKQGTSETCDQEVLKACQRAFDSLKDEVWQGRYVFVVTNATTGTNICKATFDADNNNALNPFLMTYKASDIKMGDYYYSDGTWSDGGLREIKGDGTMEWEELMPGPENGKTVIGIVFYVGQHPTDMSDYSATGIGQKKCHGYVVALTDVFNCGLGLSWEYKDRKYNKVVGTSTNEIDWNGYANCQKIQDFINSDDGERDGWAMEHFPAFLACENYGKKTYDRMGNEISNNRYDWQKQMAAPSNTSGWFLPSCGQLKYLYDKEQPFTQRMDEIRMHIDNGDLYIAVNWFHKLELYWSSTEHAAHSDSAWIVMFDRDFQYNTGKGSRCYVRPVLAF